ncbi:MAG: hypothetical protein BWY85_02420 [Firmicutes bacterium ADurb.Bin506]|nr:MAG: hypothetical protein BWY85_02420 [Firmicutes bacterium ADurb.Bin506]
MTTGKEKMKGHGDSMTPNCILVFSPSNVSTIRTGSTSRARAVAARAPSTTRITRYHMLPPLPG